MYNGPPLPKDVVLPVGLEIEFLKAVGSGKPDVARAKKSWSFAELSAASQSLPSGLQAFEDESIRKVCRGNTSGRIILPSVHALLAAGEPNGPEFIERLNAAAERYDRSNEAAAHDEARRRFALPGDFTARARTFLAWGEALLNGRFSEFLPSNEEEPSRAPQDLALNRAGLRRLETRPTLQVGFRRFLNSSVLPYFSRDLFAKSEPGAGRLELSEAELVADLQRASTSSVVLISGPGGVGKTRLALELGFATADPGTAFQVTEAVDFDRLTNHFASGERAGRLTLFLDYAENFSASAALCDFLEMLEQEYSIVTILVMCCRASSVHVAMRKYGALNLRLIEVGTKRTGDGPTYERWVVQSILGHYALANSALVETCKDVPVMAAFAAYLAHHNDNTVFEGQFSEQVATSPDLSAWFERRIGRLLERLAVRSLDVAVVGLAMPLPFARRSAVVTQRRVAAFEALLDDRWIEWNDVEFLGAHDIFTDALIAHHIFGAGDPTYRLAEVLGAAIESQFFLDALKNVGRLAAHRGFSRIDPIGLWRLVAGQYPKEVEQCALEIIESRLLNDTAIPRVLAAVDPLFKGLLSDGRAQVRLSKIAAALALQERKSEDWSRFERLLDSAAKRAILPTRVLPGILKYSPQRFAPLVLARIIRSINVPETSYLVASYLSETKAYGDLAPVIGRWLKRYSTRWQASTVYFAWDNCGGPWVTEDGRPAQILWALMRWCTLHADSVLASRQLQILVARAVGPIRATEVAELWLRAHGESLTAGHVLASWVKSTLPRDGLPGYIDRWLERHCHTVEAQFLYTASIESGMSFAIFRDHILVSLRAARSVEQRFRLCNLWMQWGGSTEEIGRFFFGALEIDSVLPNTRFAMQSWAKSSPKGARSIRHYMRLWLEANAHEEWAGYIIEIWLESRFPVSEIETHLIRWFSDYPDNPRALEFAIRLRAMGGLSRTLQSNIPHIPLTAQSVSTLETLAQDDDLFDIFKSEYMAWLAEFGHTENAVFLLQYLLHHHLQVPLLRTFAEGWVQANFGRGRLGLMLETMIRCQFDASYVEPLLQTWLTSYPAHPKAGRTLATWLKHTIGQPREPRIVTAIVTWLEAAEAGNFEDSGLVRELMS